MSKVTESPEDALARIQQGMSKNDIAVIYHFADCGVDPQQIDPRKNVLTLHAWRGKGRRVAKGAISCRIATWIPVNSKAEESADEKPKRGRNMRPKTAYVFHESQTVPLDAPKGERPPATANPALFRQQETL